MNHYGCCSGRGDYRRSALRCQGNRRCNGCGKLAPCRTFDNLCWSSHRYWRCARDPGCRHPTDRRNLRRSRRLVVAGGGFCRLFQLRSRLVVGRLLYLHLSRYRRGRVSACGADQGRRLDRAGSTGGIDSAWSSRRATVASLKAPIRAPWNYARPFPLKKLHLQLSRCRRVSLARN